MINCRITIENMSDDERKHYYWISRTAFMQFKKCATNYRKQQAEKAKRARTLHFIQVGGNNSMTKKQQRIVGDVQPKTITPLNDSSGDDVVAGPSSCVSSPHQSTKGDNDSVNGDTSSPVWNGDLKCCHGMCEPRVQCQYLL